MGNGSGSALDRGDLELGETAAESLGLVEALAALEFEGDALGSAELAEHFCGDRRAIDDRGTDAHIAAFTDEQGVEADFRIQGGIELFDIELGAWFDAVLLAAGFDDCVGHGRIGWGVRWGRGPEIRPRGPGGHHGPTAGARIFLKKAEEKAGPAVFARLKGGPIVGAAGQRMLGQMLHE